MGDYEALKAELAAATKRADDRDAVITEIHEKVPTTSASSGVDNRTALVLEIAKLAAKRKKSRQTGTA